MDTIATQTTPPTIHPFSGISLEELSMSHIGSAMDQHMFSIPTLRPYSVIGMPNSANSMCTTPAPAFLHSTSGPAVSGRPVLMEADSNRTASMISSIDRPHGPTMDGPPGLMHPLQQRLQRNLYTPLLGPPACSPGGLCSAPFSEEELSRPMPRADIPVTSTFGMSMANHLGRSLPLLLDHNNNRLSIDQSNQIAANTLALDSESAQLTALKTGQTSQLSASTVTSTAQKSQQMPSSDFPSPPPLPPPPSSSACPTSTSRPTSRRSSFHQTRPLSPSTFSESSSCTPAGGKKIGFRVGSPPPEMHFKRWTLPRNLHQQRLQRQQQHWQRLHFTELQQQRAQRSAALDDNQPRPTSARSRTPTLSKRTRSAVPTASSATANVKQKRPLPATNSNSKSYGSHAQLSPTTGDKNSDRLMKWQRLQQFLQSAAPPFLFPAQLPLPTSYAKYLYETATHKYYTIPGKAVCLAFHFFEISNIFHC